MSRERPRPASLILPIFREVPIRWIKRMIRESYEFASWAGVPLHLVAPPRLASSVKREVNGFLAEREKEPGPPVEIWALSGDFEKEVISFIQDHPSSLLLLGVETRGKQRARFIESRRILMERSPIPLLVIPVFSAWNLRDIESMTVALSGETSRSHALDLALRMGDKARVPIDLIHISHTQGGIARDPSVLGTAEEEAHHEYPRMREEFIAQASPYSSGRERLWIRSFVHVCGDVVRALQRRMHGRPQSILVMEWKGNLGPGHAKVLREVLIEAKFPLLIVREESAPISSLMIGDRVASR